MKLHETNVSRRRLANQYLTEARLSTPTEVVATMGAIQAQDYAGAKWAVAQRTENPADVAVERAVSEGSIIRTHVLRPTWHFVAPADIRWMLSLTASRINGIMAYSNRMLELDDVVFRRSERLMRRALECGKQLTRKELSRILGRAGINVVGDGRLVRLLMRAELDAIICSGARRDGQFTYALLEDRVPVTPQLERDEALAKLCLTYFSTRGPATLADFAWWSGLTLADSRRGIELVAPSLGKEVNDGRTLWFTETSMRRKSVPSAHLLPNYDEFLVAYRDRAALGQRLKSSGVDLRTVNLLANMVALDGQVAGTWKRVLKSESVAVELSLFTSLTQAEMQRIAKATQRYGDYLGLASSLHDSSRDFSL